ncbi:MAG: amidohydrolase family protein [Oligoflexia bacterium]|nr:amidohydrolase family protein [Oligoflexia bacterium]
MLLLKNVFLIPQLTDSKLKIADILIKDGYIIKIEKDIKNLSSKITTIDLKDRFLTPGFIDLHLHLTLTGSDTLHDNFRNNYYKCMQAYSSALASLKAGFTTIRDLGSDDRIVNHVRDAINKNSLPGPTIISAGKILTPTETGNEYFSQMYQECDGHDEVMKYVRNEIKQGADFIKLMCSGAFMNPGGDPQQLLYSDEEIITAVKIAKTKNKYVAAHAHGSEAIKQCIRCGVRTIEHATMIDDKAIQELSTSNSKKKNKSNNNTFIVPTITAFVDTPFIENIRNAYESKLIIGFGTDQGIENTFHGQNANEFIFRKKLIGMKDIDILLQATKYNSIIAQIDKSVGTIDVGKKADLVILNKDPTKDIIACKDAVHMVIKNGKREGKN